MALNVVELKAVSALIVRARGLIEDALVIAEAGADVAVKTRVKTLLFRAKDTLDDIDGRAAAAEKRP